VQIGVFGVAVGRGSLLWCDLHEHCLYSVVAVAVAVPRGLAGLGAARKVGAPGLDGVPAGLVSSTHHCQLWLAWAAWRG
jgi:hypothetical protein